MWVWPLDWVCVCVCACLCVCVVCVCSQSLFSSVVQSVPGRSVGVLPPPSLSFSSRHLEEHTSFWSFYVSYRCTTLSHSTRRLSGHPRSQSAGGTLCTTAWSGGLEQRLEPAPWGRCWGPVGDRGWRGTVLQLSPPPRRSPCGWSAPPSPLWARAEWHVIKCSRIRAPLSGKRTRRHRSFSRVRTAARGRSR